MKLIEKRCPNCGAALSFSENDDKVYCEYCNMNYDIKKEDNNNIDLVKVETFGKIFASYFIISSALSFFFFLIVLALILFVILKMANVL